MSNGIESFLVVFGPKDKNIDIIFNFDRFRVYPRVLHSSIYLQGAILCQVFITSGRLSSG